MSRVEMRFVGVVCLIAVVALGLVASSGGGTRFVGSAKAQATGKGELDCNGWSHKYKSAKQAMMALCTDPIAIKNGKVSRFVDNGWYVGHDEPSTKFISSARGSGNHMTYYLQLPKDPSAAPPSTGA